MWVTGAEMVLKWYPGHTALLDDRNSGIEILEGFLKINWENWYEQQRISLANPQAQC